MKGFQIDRGTIGNPEKCKWSFEEHAWISFELRGHECEVEQCGDVSHGWPVGMVVDLDCLVGPDYDEIAINITSEEMEVMIDDVRVWQVCTVHAWTMNLVVYEHMASCPSAEFAKPGKATIARMCECPNTPVVETRVSIYLHHYEPETMSEDEWRELYGD